MSRQASQSNNSQTTVKQLKMNPKIITSPLEFTRNGNPKVEQYMEEANPEAIRFDGIDEAIIGTDYNGWLVYDYNKMVAAFMLQGMEGEEAIEWVDYNVLPINAGNGFTVVFT